MGFYECIHDCGDGEHCVSIGSSIDNFASTSWAILCNKHKSIDVGSKFKYIFKSFIEKFKKSNRNQFIELVLDRSKSTDEILDMIKNERLQNSFAREVEIVDMKDFKIRKGTIKIVRFKVTDLDFSILDPSKKINFSMFDGDVSSWDENSKIVTLQFDKNCIYRSPYYGKELYYRWNCNKIGRIEDYKLHEKENEKIEI